MAKIQIFDVVIGVGVGGVDQFLEDKDAAAGRVDEMKKRSAWFRTGATVLGYLGQATGQFTEYAEPLAQSGLPLLTKSVYKAVSAATGTTARSVTRSRVVGNYSRTIAQTTKPEFEGQRSY